VIALAAVVEVAQAPAETRIDTFDKNSKRTGYIIVDHRTGRIDQFDTHGRRLGYGYLQPGPLRGTERLDRQGQRSDGNRRRQ